MILLPVLLWMFAISHNKKFKKGKWQRLWLAQKPTLYRVLISSVNSMFFPLLDMLSSSASSPAPAPEPEPAPAPAPSAPQPSKTAKPFGCGYPALQPGYQNATAPLNSGVPPSSPGYSGFQPYAQVCIKTLQV